MLKKSIVLISSATLLLILLFVLMGIFAAHLQKKTQTVNIAEVQKLNGTVLTLNNNTLELDTSDGVILVYLYDDTYVAAVEGYPVVNGLVGGYLAQKSVNILEAIKVDSQLNITGTFDGNNFIATRVVLLQ